ncbi:MAG: carboxypeptidase-like regulatory domain-containing protein, partial [Balneolales bacterium]
MTFKNNNYDKSFDINSSVKRNITTLNPMNQMDDIKINVSGLKTYVETVECNIKSTLVRSKTFVSVILFLLLFAIISPEVYAQTATITGEVTDAETGEALAGATVLVKGTSQGVATDIDGRYTLRRAPVGDQVLVYRYIGYITQEIPITIISGDNPEQNVQLSGDHIEGDDLLVIGHQRGQSRALTRQRESVNIRSVMSSERIDRMTVTTVSGALARVAGMHGGTNI